MGELAVSFGWSAFLYGLESVLRKTKGLADNQSCEMNCFDDGDANFSVVHLAFGPCQYLRQCLDIVPNIERNYISILGRSINPRVS